MNAFDAISARLQHELTAYENGAAHRTTATPQEADLAEALLTLSTVALQAGWLVISGVLTDSRGLWGDLANLLADLGAQCRHQADDGPGPDGPERTFE